MLDKIYNDKLKLINQNNEGCNLNEIYNLNSMGKKYYKYQKICLDIGHIRFF